MAEISWLCWAVITSWLNFITTKNQSELSSGPSTMPAKYLNHQRSLPKQIKEKPSSWRAVPLAPCNSLSSSDQQGRAVESLCPRRTLTELLYSLCHQHFTGTTRDAVFYQFCGVMVRKKVPWSHRGHVSFKRYFFWAKTAMFFVDSGAEGSQSYSDHQFMCLIILWTSVGEWKWWPQQESRENQATARESADAAATLKSDAWKQFGFVVSANEVTDKQSAHTAREQLAHTYGTYI